MEDEEINLQYQKKIYIYKTLYLIRTNLPTSEILYMIMFFLKYIGLIILSISLNEWEIGDLKMKNIKDTNNIESNSSIFNFQSFFSKFLITGNSLKILIKNYAEISLFGFYFLIIYIISIIFGIFYMKKKYYNNNIITLTEKKLKKLIIILNLKNNFLKLYHIFFSLLLFFINI